MNLEWPPERRYTLADARALLRTVHSAMRLFRRVSDEEYRSLGAALAPLNRWLSTPVDMDQLLSVRVLLNTHLGALSRARLPRLRSQLQQYFSTYRSIREPAMDVVMRGSTLFSLSPLTMTEQYLLSRDYSPQDVRNMAREPTTYAPRSLRPVVEWAQQEDALGPQQTTFQRGGAEGYERHLEGWLRVRGCVFRTQRELAQEQVHQHGHAVSTPDILFAEPVEIRRSDPAAPPLVVRWLDAKNYLYSPLTDFDHLDDLEMDSYLPSLVDRQLLKQYARYETHHGPGAFVFSGGYVHFPLPDTFPLLDLQQKDEPEATSLPI